MPIYLQAVGFSGLMMKTPKSYSLHGRGKHSNISTRSRCGGGSRDDRVVDNPLRLCILNYWSSRK